MGGVMTNTGHLAGIWARTACIALAAAFTTASCQMDRVETTAATGSAAGGATGAGGDVAGGSAISAGGAAPVDCIHAEDLDPCVNYKESCSYVDPMTTKYCINTCKAYCPIEGAWAGYNDTDCDEYWPPQDPELRWSKQCHCCQEPPGLCPTELPEAGSECPVTPECECYECTVTCPNGKRADAACHGWWSTAELSSPPVDPCE